MSINIMIKTSLISLCLMLAGTMSAATYGSMVFTMTDNSAYSIGTQGLVMTVSGDKLLVVNDANESLEFPLTSLISMQFGGEESKIDETVTTLDGNVTIFSPAGLEIGRFSSVNEARTSLAPGIYIIKDQTGNTIKLLIEK